MRPVNCLKFPALGMPQARYFAIFSADYSGYHERVGEKRPGRVATGQVSVRQRNGVLWEGVMDKRLG